MNHQRYEPAQDQPDPHNDRVFLVAGLLPARPRRVAVVRALPPPGLVGAVMLTVASLVVDETWPLLLALAVIAYHLVVAYLADRWDPACEIAAHWHGDGEMPEELAEECPACVDAPLRALWARSTSWKEPGR